jgi:pimeloyl-ACP methyl ester carboxylesterase
VKFADIKFVDNARLPSARVVVLIVAGSAAFLSSLFLSSLSLSSVAVAQVTPAWRYDLRPGDHLIYRYSFHRQSQSSKDKDRDEERFQTEAHFRAHVLVTAENSGTIALGFQRNRESAELTEYVSKGKDQLAHERPDFQKRMRARPTHFSEAMEVSAIGDARYPWEIARESTSHLIGAVHEVMPLPPTPLAKGEIWHGSVVLGLDFRWIDDEIIHGKSCHHIEGSSPAGNIKLSYWWSPESGVIEQLILDGSYPNYDTTVHESARMELESRTRGESLDLWLESPDTQQAALQSILLSPDVPISAGQLAPLLSSDTSSNGSATQSLALAIASRRGIDLLGNDLPPALLRNLQQSSSTLIQSEIRQLTEAHSGSESPSSTVDECHRPLPPKPPHPKSGTSFEVVQATKDTPEIPYLLRVPPSYRASGDRPAPLLVYLSGGAGYAIDAVNSAEDVVAQTDYLVLYPQAAGYWWTPETARRFDAAFNDVIERFNIDRDRIYITGFSNGGTGALYYATLWPHRFAAVVTQMGAGQCNEQVKAGLANARNLPLLLIHGENDTTITPDCSTTTQSAINDFHPATAPELKILPKHGHDITLESDEGLTLPFFQNKVRNPFPRTVDLIETDALATRAYWVEILDGKPGKSDIDARVKADNTIEIHSHDVKRIRLHLRPELLPKPGDFRIVWNGKKLFSGTLRDRCSRPSSSVSADPELDLADTRDLTLP